MIQWPRVYWGRPRGKSDVELIGDHVAEHFREVDYVLHELISDNLHIDVHHIAPTPDRDVHVLFTTGMSALPMTVPQGAEEFRYAELMMYLPARWPMEQLRHW